MLCCRCFIRQHFEFTPNLGLDCRCLPKSEALLYCFGKTAGFLLISKAAFTKRLILLMCFWYFSPVITAFSIIKIPKVGVHKSIFGIYFMKNCPGRVFFTKSAFPLDEFWYSAPCLRELRGQPAFSSAAKASGFFVNCRSGQSFRKVRRQPGYSAGGSLFRLHFKRQSVRVS